MPDGGSLANTFAQRFTQPLSSSAATAIQGSFNRSQKELNYKAYIISTDQKMLIEAWLPETLGTDVTAQYDTPYAQGVSGMLPDGIGQLARFMGMSMTTQALTLQIWQGGSMIDMNIPFIFQADTSGGAVDVMKPIKNLMKLTMPVDSAAASGGGGILTAPGPHIDPKLLTKNGVTASSNFLTNLTGSITNGQAGAALTNAGQSLLSAFSSGGIGAAAGEAVGSLIDGAQAGLNAVAQPVSQSIVSSIVNNISLYIGQFLYLPSVVIKSVSPTYDVIIGTDGNPIRATVNVQFSTFYMPTTSDIENMFPSATDAIVGATVQNSGSLGNLAGTAAGYISQGQSGV